VLRKMLILEGRTFGKRGGAQVYLCSRQKDYIFLVAPGERPEQSHCGSHAVSKERTVVSALQGYGGGPMRPTNSCRRGSERRGTIDSITFRKTT